MKLQPFRLLLPLLACLLLPMGARAAPAKVLRNIAYGSNPLQRYDVYLPANADDAPVIFMVHGGGWRRGDKAASAVVEAKVARWVSRGFVLVSANYRLLPTPIDEQADDVAHALASAQDHATQWGADPRQFILMGHSAGAQLVALVNADPARAMTAGARPWLGAILIDTAMLNVPRNMRRRHPRLYDRAFGTQSRYWRKVSPLQQLRADAPPMLLVCSSRRRRSCPQAHAFAAAAHAHGVRAKVISEARGHRQLDADLGGDNAYTRQVERFMARLAPAIAQRLAGSYNPHPH
jgi:acetyl esterase/lipase